MKDKYIENLRSMKQLDDAGVLPGEYFGYSTPSPMGGDLRQIGIRVSPLFMTPVENTRTSSSIETLRLKVKEMNHESQVQPS